ncbi:signal transduction histidine kinase [Variovorax sp. GrIS 2.14]|uniref:sensor histidine kinase n=1 Tax=Variovorax sp. GrIS 2.14 TaxID=3071709 RepID=UPI0038F81B76
MDIIDQEKIQDLPRWAQVALVIRFAKRFVEFYSGDSSEPAVARAATSQALQLAEARCADGGDTEDYEPIEIDGQHYDNYDVHSLQTALIGFANGAENTLADLHRDPEIEPIVRRHLLAIQLASFAVEIAFASDISKKSDIERGIKQALEHAVLGEPEISLLIETDLSLITAYVESESLNSSSGVDVSSLGELWPYGKPKSWPAIKLSFRPRARLIRTIGDRLISGPEAAVIELVKNSYDADANTVRVTFYPPFTTGEGRIAFLDDGHGMSLTDIQQKWMEPATSDKRDRKHSLSGRPLLGSKGIGRFAAARLGRYLGLESTSKNESVRVENAPRTESSETTRIPVIDWQAFEETKYLDDVSFEVESSLTALPSGTLLTVTGLRDEWNEHQLVKLHQELRRLISPVQSSDRPPFKIFLDLSQCTVESSGFDGRTLMRTVGSGLPSSPSDQFAENDPFEIAPFPILEACDYAVDGVFDETGVFRGTMTIRRAGQEPEPVELAVPAQSEDLEQSCGVVLVRLNIFDREAEAIRSTAEKAGFGKIGVREARKLLDSIAGVAIYREGFRVRPYGDGENDWLTLDAKRVQNPTMKIGRNQIAGIIMVDDEQSSQLVERSSREGLEENGSFRRLQNLILTLLSEVVEPRRRKFRISAGIDVRTEASFRDIYDRVQLGWSKMLLAKIPEGDRQEAEELISKESDRLTAYVKRLEDRQAQLEAQVTLGLIIGEVMHQGNTPLSFVETEVSRLSKWWPSIFNGTQVALENIEEVPRILNGMRASSISLRQLFNALSPLSGARRGNPEKYAIVDVVRNTAYLFQTKFHDSSISFEVAPEVSKLTGTGFPNDLSTALTNLIDNAIYWLIHHKIKSPRIVISGVKGEDKSVLYVEDNGAGIPEEFRDQLFDVGFTLKPSGTGLGLSIAREAIFRSGGDLTIAHSDQGTRFLITLPK